MGLAPWQREFVATEAERIKQRDYYKHTEDDYESPTAGRGVAVAALVSLGLFFAIIIYLMSLVVVWAEPGDKYDIRLATAHAPAIAAGHGMVPHDSLVVGGAPTGCPPRRFCGCAISIDYFGKPDPKLFLAANWLRFPRTKPAPGMVAARKGHVMKLLAHVSGKQWQVYDPNSGKGLTRIHVRSISGFTIVNPRA